jgi:hypothetical protein
LYFVAPFSFVCFCILLKVSVLHPFRKLMASTIKESLGTQLDFPKRRPRLFRPGEEPFA